MVQAEKKIGIGIFEGHDAKSAGKEAAYLALKELHAGQNAGWAMVFAGGRHAPDEVLSGLRSQLGDLDIIGGSAVGGITHNFANYSGYECVVALFPASIAKPHFLVATDLDKGEEEAGRRLGAQLNEAASEDSDVFLFYDTVRTSPPPVLNTASRLVEGIYNGLGDKQLNITGAGLVGDFQLSGSYVFDGRHYAKQAAAAVVLPSELSAHTTIMHGCIPISSFMEITRVDGPIIYEIDHRPALDVLNEIFGEQQGCALVDNLSLIMTLGEKHGDPMAPYSESVYVNRLIVHTNPDDGSVILFEADFKQGAKIQIMTRDNTLMLESVRKRSTELLQSINSSIPVGGFYINCAGRCSAFTGTDVEDAKILQKQWNGNVPLFGFYSGVELAPLMGRTRPLDWTGVLTLFTVEEN